MRPSSANPLAKLSLMVAMKLAKEESYLHLFAEGALSFLAFLLSIFIYLSFSTHHYLVKHTNFWFCISNTLILILAVDSGVFSPPPLHNYRLHDGGHHRLINNSATTISKIPHTTENSTIPLKFNCFPTKSYQRSKSEKVKKVVEKERKITMRRSKTMIRHNASMKEKEEKNEFREMTDEELNRKVEEFIERFKRKTRLQEIKHDYDE